MTSDYQSVDDHMDEKRLSGAPGALGSPTSETDVSPDCVFKVGEQVMYSLSSDNSCEKCRATIVSVQHDFPDIYYTIALDGLEKQTIAKRLSAMESLPPPTKPNQEPKSTGSQLMTLLSKSKDDHQPDAVQQLCAGALLCDLVLKDPAGNTLLHLGISNEYYEEMTVLIEKYPTGIKAKNNKGLTPLHVALLLKAPEKVIKTMIDHWSGDLETKIHSIGFFVVSTLLCELLVFACITILLRVQKTIRVTPWNFLYFGLLLVPFVTRQKREKSFLLFAIENDASAEILELLVERDEMAYQREKLYTSKKAYMNGNTPLHVALERLGEEGEVDGEFLNSMQEKIRILTETITVVAADVHKLQNCDGNTPLHIAVAKKASRQVIRMVFDMCPDAATIQNKKQQRPLDICIYSKCLQTFKGLLYADFPLDDNGIKRQNFHTWTDFLEMVPIPGLSEPLVEEICKERMGHIKALAYDVYNRGEKTTKRLQTAMEVSPENIQKILRKYCAFLGRYDVGPAVHESATAYVFIAEMSTMTGIGTGDSRVALKFMKAKSQYSNELEAREHITLSPSSKASNNSCNSEAIIQILEHIDGDDDSDYTEAVALKGLSEYPYLLVFPACDRSLADMIVHDSICGKLEKIKTVIREICSSLHVIHESKRIHGDIKPLNIMKLHSGSMILIDLDASVAFGTYCGSKVSSAYLPPEMILLNPEEDEAGKPTSKNFAQELKASASFDMWALGVTLYHLCTGSTLWKADVQDNLDDYRDMKDLHTWSREIKDKKLAVIEEALAHNLVHQLLSKDPTLRPDVSHVLAHPFITGRHTSCRLPGQNAKYKSFISYRTILPDETIAQEVYKELTNLHVDTFLDKKCLTLGKNWQRDFIQCLNSTDIFIPLISRESINSLSNPSKNFTCLTESSPCDNVLLEYRMAIELSLRGLITSIVPIFIGDNNSSLSANDFLSYTFRDDPLQGHTACYPQFDASLPSVVVASVEKQTRDYLEEMGLGSPLKACMSVNEIMEYLQLQQGRFITGSLHMSLSTICSDIARLVQVGERGDVCVWNKADAEKALMEKDEEIASLNARILLLSTSSVGQLAIDRSHSL